MSAVLTMKSATFSADGTRLLGPLNFSLSAAGITAVMGANGAGKSLFLRLAHGLIQPTDGQVFWGDATAIATIRKRGFVFQNNPVMRRSVMANIAFPLIAAGLEGTGERVQNALAMARLDDQAQLPAAQLSGGQRQRMALARALVTEPDVLLLDEPSASLDPASTKALEAMVQGVAEHGVKVVIATHDTAQARRLADDILFFDQGTLAEQATADTFFTAPESNAAHAYFEGRL